jgi:colanic acid/amylovoran biosynthesis glycosyltransferase
MPELTVCIPAPNVGASIREAVAHILRQRDVDFELIVVDDGGKNFAADRDSSLDDSRVKLIGNKGNQGAAFCNNVAIEHSASPFIISLTADDMLLPGVFERMVHVLKSSPDVGGVCGYHFYVDEDGRITRDAFRKWRKFLFENVVSSGDYKMDLLVNAGFIGPVRAYRRELFEDVGYFNVNQDRDPLFEMDLRIADKCEVRVLPEFLSCTRKPKRSGISPRLEAVRLWIKRMLTCRSILKSDPRHFLSERRYSLSKFMVRGLLTSLGFAQFFKRNIPGRALWKIRRLLTEEILTPTLRYSYKALVNYASWWPIDMFTFHIRNQLDQERRVAYVLWRFPTLTQTFIQREVEALRRFGCAVEVFSEASGALDLLDENAKAISEGCHYLKDADNRLLKDYQKRFFLKNPFLFLNLFLYVVTHRYASFKSFREDIRIFSKAVLLAGALQEKKISHVHSPWADQFAFIALIASRLLRVSFSVQARASADLYRHRHSYALREKFETAEFIITNTQYNESFLKSFLSPRDWWKIYIIYNGIRLEHFKPKEKQKKLSKETRLLTVATLGETKGFIYLLKSCKALKERGFIFKCEIIGGTHEPLYTNYCLELKKLRGRFGLERCVSFLGAQPFNKVLEEYKNTDIFILPCVVARDGSRDVTPNVLIEAMAMKIPVISTNITGIPELVQDGISGILVPPKNERALTEAIIRLINDDTLRRYLGEKAREKVEERFDINKNILKYIDLFQGTKQKQVYR